MTMLRCVGCGREITHYGPPIVASDGRVGWPPESEKPTQMDVRMGTGWCPVEGKKVFAVMAETYEDAIAAGRTKRRRVKTSVPDDMWPEGTNFGVRRAR